MRPGVRTDGMAGGENLLEDFGIIGSVFSDREENASRAFVGQRLEDGGRVLRPRAVVKGQHDFLVAQEIQLLEMLEAKSGPPVVSISTTRPIPSASGLAQGRFGRRRRGGRSGGGWLGVGLGRWSLRPRRTARAE